MFVISAGLVTQCKIKGHTREELDAVLNDLYKDIRSNTFNTGSIQHWESLDYPQKMRNMQKLAIQDITKSNESQKKVRIHHT